MARYEIKKVEGGETIYRIAAKGYELLRNPILNKGGAFTPRERTEFNIDGFLPPKVSTLERQVERNYKNYCTKDSDLGKFIFLRSLQDRNETVFYALLMKHLEEMIPIVYTPTVGLACEKFSHIFRFTRGLYMTLENIDRADQIFGSLPYKDIKMIVVTDAEGILGIGDQGIGGMGIPVGKLSLYTAAAGIHPAACLPIILDVGTDNEELLADPLYLGIRDKRIRGESYIEFVERFVCAVKRKFPNALIQWEDFSKQNAFTLLDKYRDEVVSFNDDIQGTGAVALAGVLAGLTHVGKKLEEQQFVIHGAGAGGIGVARQIHVGLTMCGLSDEEAYGRIFVLDSRGVIYQGRKGVDAYKRPFAKASDFPQQCGKDAGGMVGLSEVIEHTGATVLLGLSGVAGVFDNAVLKAMGTNSETPLIFPLSNPTDNAETTPADIFIHAGPGAIVATGSPFDDVEVEGDTRTIGQGNNVFIFPGVGLGALSVGASVVTDEMFTVAAFKLAGLVDKSQLDKGCVYPPVSDLRSVCLDVAEEVAKKAMEQQVATVEMPEPGLRNAIKKMMWKPRYARYEKAQID